MDENVIDLNRYRHHRSDDGGRTTFAIWGADGDRSRFALPLWRAIYLAGGTRGALAWIPGTEDPPGEPRCLVVLDLASDPPRLTFPAGLLGGVRMNRAPALELQEAQGGLAVFLGEHGERRWFLLVAGREGEDSLVDGQARDDILFLAGECAGLLFFRGLGLEAEE